MGLGGGERREAGLDVRKVVKALEDSRRKRNRGHGLWWDGGILELLLTLCFLAARRDQLFSATDNLLPCHIAENKIDHGLN